MRSDKSGTWTIWTDGSSQGSRIEWKHGYLCERGGYGTVITKDGTVVEKLYQGFKNTTNNRCELFGVLEALRYFEQPTKMIIYSDSQYVVNSINNGSAVKWFKDLDYSKKNLDIWVEILDLLEFHDVEMVWVKGHASNEGNILADRLATHAANCLNLKTDICISD